MQDISRRSPTPWHLWILGLFALIWNGFGSYDFARTSLGGASYLRRAGYDGYVIEYYANLPEWVTVAWGIGVLGGLLGALLLLLRRRIAFHAFVFSFVGALISVGYGLQKAPPPPPKFAVMQHLHWVILTLCLVFVVYTFVMAKRRVVR